MEFIQEEPVDENNSYTGEAYSIEIPGTKNMKGEK